MTNRIAAYASLVKLSHTIFAAPFAVAAALLAGTRPHPPVTVARALAIALCLVSARTAAMAYNRLVDRDVDARNPRTATREIPAGVVRPRSAAALVVGASLVFVGCAWALGAVTGLLALPVLFALLGYSHAKRFTWGAHLWLGVALGLAPGGAWLAVGARPEWGLLALMLAVSCWAAGFDVLYGLQDEAFDREEGLRSIPARFGARRAVLVSRALHLGAVSSLAAAARSLGGGRLLALGVALVVALLVYEHALLRPRGSRGERLTPDGTVSLERLDKAFFDVNGWVSLAFLALVAADVLLRRS